MDSYHPAPLREPVYAGPLIGPDGATRHLEPGEVPLGGGTDLLPLTRDGILRPVSLADIGRTPGLVGIRENTDGSISIGGGTTLTDIARHGDVRGRYPALAEACEAVGTQQLRNTGTLGGNLCQRPRCWYFRHGHECLKTGGTRCSALNGENAYHAIFHESACVAAHPSDPAVALTALDAIVMVAGQEGVRPVAVADFFQPGHPDRETAAGPGEYVAAVVLGASAAGGVQRYFKLMQRAAWDFALVSLCAARRLDGEVRLVLGGVAGRPWRVTGGVEDDLAAGVIARDDLDALAARALYDARPLGQNEYKVEMAAALLRRGIAAISGPLPLDATGA